jgi:hypothetical protein
MGVKDAFSQPGTSATVSGDDGLYQSSTDTTLCSDLTLTVKDSEANPHQLYQGPLAAMTSVNLSTQGGSPIWDPGESDTFTFNLSLPNSTPTDEDSACTAAFTWSQNGV